MSIAQTELTARDGEWRLLKVYHTELQKALEKRGAAPPGCTDDVEGVVERITALLRNVSDM